MFTLPSIWNLIVSTLVFFIAVAHLRRYLDGRGISDGKSRGILVFALASLLSWGAGEAADWTQATLEDTPPEAAVSVDAPQAARETAP